MIQRISYDQFVQLDGDRLIEYMDPLLASGDAKLDDVSVRRLLDDLDSFDEYHLVYALELGSQAAPNSLATQLPLHLSDPRTSVFCAALNAIDRLPDQHLIPELIAAVRASNPVQPGSRRLVQDLATRLEQRRAAQQ